MNAWVLVNARVLCGWAVEPFPAPFLAPFFPLLLAAVILPSGCAATTDGELRVRYTPVAFRLDDLLFWSCPDLARASCDEQRFEIDGSRLALPFDVPTGIGVALGTEQAEAGRLRFGARAGSRCSRRVRPGRLYGLAHADFSSLRLLAPTPELANCYFPRCKLHGLFRLFVGDRTLERTNSFATSRLVVSPPAGRQVLGLS